MKSVIELENILKDKKVDLLFIDGDHTYDGIKNDYLIYNKFVKKGGFIVFHDIKNTDYHKSVNCNVDIFWDELKKLINTNFIEYCSDDHWGGIGIMIKNN